MSRPTSRVLALLDLLQATGRMRTATELAGRLGVDERTVRRYVSHLRDLDIPVETVRGPHGGIRLLPGHRMPPLMFTDEEAVAVLVGLLGGAGGPDARAAAAAEVAAAKVLRVMPTSLSRHLRVLERGPDPVGGGGEDAQLVSTLARATVERHPVRLEHRSSAGLRTTRTVHPHGLVSAAGHWYLSATDPAHGMRRIFRVDRVVSAAPLPDVLPGEDAVDPVREVSAALARTHWRHDVRVLVQGGADEVRAQLPDRLATVLDSGEPGWVRVRLEAEHLDWVPAVLAGLSGSFRVEAPEELRQLVRDLAGRLTRSVADP